MYTQIGICKIPHNYCRANLIQRGSHSDILSAYNVTKVQAVSLHFGRTIKEKISVHIAFYRDVYSFTRLLSLRITRYASALHKFGCNLRKNMLEYKRSSEYFLGQMQNGDMKK